MGFFCCCDDEDDTQAFLLADSEGSLLAAASSAFSGLLPLLELLPPAADAAGLACISVKLKTGFEETFLISKEKVGLFQ